MKNSIPIFLISIGIFVIFFEPFNFSWLPFGNDDTKQVSVTDEVNWINVDVSSANTKIIPENRESVKAVLEGKGKLTLDKEEDSIEVNLKTKWFDWVFFDDSQLTIYIPEDYHNNMKVEVGSGNLNFAGDSQNNPFHLAILELDMSSGNTNFKNLSVKEFILDGSSGNVNIDSLTTQTGTFDISSGSLDVNNYSGALQAKLSSGKMNVQLDELGDDIKVDISSGKVELDLPKNSDFTLHGKVSSGNISSDFPLENKKVEKEGIEGTYGTGKHSIELSVSSGSIEVY